MEQTMTQRQAVTKKKALYRSADRAGKGGSWTSWSS
jgi:hypothetical protein